jgi:hypothetical protein
MIIAFVGGKWQNRSRVLEITFYRPFPISASVGAHLSRRRRKPESDSTDLK